MRTCIVFASLLLIGAAAQAQLREGPEVTEDGLVRVDSTPRAGVYRLPVATFHQYQRVMLDPVKVTYKKGWKQKHPELNAEERAKLSADLAYTFHEELIKELVTRGGYQIAKEPAPDVLRVEASAVNVDITAPEASLGQMQKTYVTSAGSMKVIVELKDAMSGVIVARIINFEEAPERRDALRDFQRNPSHPPPPTTQISNLADFRLGFENSSRFTHEAISVAKSAKREEQQAIKSDY